jgi:hypothetical protein
MEECRLLCDEAEGWACDAADSGRAMREGVWVCAQQKASSVAFSEVSTWELEED